MVTGRSPASQQNLQTALTLFQQALKLNPSSTDAQFGAAVTLAGLVANQFNTSSSATSGSGGAGTASGSGNGSSGGQGAPGFMPPEPSGYTGNVVMVPPPQTAGLFWNLGQDIVSPFALLQTLAPVADLRYGLLPYYGYPGDDVTGREQMLTQLTTVDQELQAIEANASFTTTLPDPSGNGGTVIVGLPEVYLFDAYVNSLRAQLGLSLAYVRDTPASTGGNGTGAGGALTGIPVPMLTTAPSPPADLNHDGKLEPNEYLPPSPYLTLRSATFMTTAQQALQEVVSDETAGITGVLARPSDGSGGFLVPNSSAVHAALVSVQTGTLPVLQQALKGPVTVQFPQFAVPDPAPFASPPGKSAPRPISQSATRAVFSNLVVAIDPIGFQPMPPPTLVSVTLDLAAWFTNPPADLKVFAPTYPLDANGYPIYSQAAYPDLTFGGLFPGGAPTSLLF
jgi:hypothetical protein